MRDIQGEISNSTGSLEFKLKYHLKLKSKREKGMGKASFE